MNEAIKYEYEETNDIYVVKNPETDVESTIDGTTVRETFEIFEELVKDWNDEMMKDIELIREITNVLCVLIREKEYVIKLALMVYGVLPITPKNTFKGDIMEIKQKVKVYNETEIEKMTDEQYDNCGVIYEHNVEDVDKYVQFNHKHQVIIALLNSGVDLRNTKEYKKLINEVKRSTTPINTNTFYDVLYNQLFEWDCPMIDLGKNIQIECVTEDASFGYDYGSISSVHHCSIVIGYNIKIEDID